MVQLSSRLLLLLSPTLVDVETSTQDLTKQILELIRLTSTDLPPVVEQPLRLFDFQPAIRFAPRGYGSSELVND